VKSGDLVDGAFTLLRPLGEGGMGEVWLARENGLARDVALKFMRETPDPARAVRFGREARALAALDHPSIPRVLRTGVDPASGLHYIATPAILLSTAEIRRLCDESLHCPYPAAMGGAGLPRPLSLSDLLDSGKALPEAAALRLARDLVGALSAAHSAGIVHRDVKPSNVLYDAAGRALLVDFGLAKFVTRHSSLVTPATQPPDSISLDSAGRRKFLGSPAYAAPEQFDPGAGPDAPALDWYSFGAVLYRALTGHRPGSPRKASSFDPRHLSRAWDPLLDSLLEPDPARRLTRPDAILRALDRVERLPAPRRLLRLLAAFWTLCLLFGLAVGTAIYGPRRLRETSGEADSRPPSSVPTAETSGEADSRPPPSVPTAETGGEADSRPPPSVPTAETGGEADSRPPSPPQPVPGVLGVVQSAAFQNPVTDFSRPVTYAGEWFGLTPPPAAGTRKTLALGAAPDRLTLVWCPPHPKAAPNGFWIVESGIDPELACEIHDNFPDDPDFRVWQPEPRYPMLEAHFGLSSATDLLEKLNALAGFGDAAHFAFPTTMQINYAKQVFPPLSASIPLEDQWFDEYAVAFSVSSGRDMAFMPLQPILVPGPRE